MTGTRELTNLRARLQFALGTGYQVGEEVGRGGMSRVFAARDLTLKRDIVVKTLPPELAGEISVERFKREIHFAASLQHPHIVPVHAAGDVDGLPYYTMPRVDGESLRDRLNRVQRLPLNEVLTVMRDVGRALAYAHRRGLVHRDIKPENILIAEGMAVVTDFGIAKALEASREVHPAAADSTSTHTGLTAAGTYLGTPNYVAPEQMAADADIDHRADLFAFGVVAYELLSGETPFPQRSGAVSGAQFAFPPRDIAAQRLDVAPVVAQLVMQCLAIAPNARPESADQIVRKLDAAMSATPLAPIGDDPSVTRKAFAWYAVAFVLATGLAWVAMIGLGLPDWVLPGAMIVMALGLPVVTTAALSRRAAALSSLERMAEVSRVGWLFTPGPMTIRLAQALTWRRVVAGGGLSLGAFGVLVTGFMVTRTLGIGPAASLLATGQVAAHQPILMTDFASASGDSAIARLVAEAVRIAFQESDVVQMTTPASVADALRRMRRAPTERVTVPLARDIAAREGIGMIADGEVLRDGDRFLLTVRLIAADSGNVVVVRHASASGVSDLVTAVDRLTRDLRSRIGESLKLVRATPPLAKVTTSSYEALLLYTQGVRAAEREGDGPKARHFVEKALEKDSTFAAAWRRLAVLVANMGEPGFSTLISRAYELRQNATETDRLMIEAQYHWIVPGGRLKSLAAFQALAEREGFPGNNYAWYTLAVRQFALSESLHRALFRKIPDAWRPYDGLLLALMNQGKWQAADSAAREALIRFPGNVGIRYKAASVRCGLRRFAECELSLDSLLRATPSLQRRDAKDARQSIAELALMRGRISRWEQLIHEDHRIDTIQVYPGFRSRAAWVDLFIRRRPASALAQLDSIRRPVGEMPIAFLYALAGRPDTGRAIVSRYEGRWGDSMPPGLRSNVQFAAAAIASSEGRVQDALDSYRASDRLPDGLPRHLCASCLPLDLATVFDAARQADSAIAYFEQFLSSPHFNPGHNPTQVRIGMNWWTFVNEAWIHERLGALYEEIGNRAKATAHLESFIELWKDADPELQPRVAAARTRLARLKAS